MTAINTKPILVEAQDPTTILSWIISLNLSMANLKEYELPTTIININNQQQHQKQRGWGEQRWSENNIKVGFYPLLHSDY